MTKVNFSTSLLDEEDLPISEGVFATLGSLCRSVLCASMPRLDESLSGEKKAEMAFLALQIRHKPDLDLTSEQITQLKARIALACPPMIVFRAHRLLEGKPQGLTSVELGLPQDSAG